MKINDVIFTEDLANKKLLISKNFNASLARVWQAWTVSEILDQWWAPKPYRAETKTMDFREGGYWLYSMNGPEGDRSFCKEDFKTIQNHKLIAVHEYFCDEDGNLDHNMPAMDWKKQFTEVANGTKIDIELTFSKAEDLEAILSMGFKEGFTAGLDNLDAYLAR